MIIYRVMEGPATGKKYRVRENNSTAYRADNSGGHINIDWHRSTYGADIIYTQSNNRAERVSDPAPMPAPQPAPQSDAVKKPKYYSILGDVEAIEIIASSMTADQFFGYCLGNIMKYRLRAGNKDALQQDIDKSNFYKELYDKHSHLCKEQHGVSN